MELLSERFFVFEGERERERVKLSINVEKYLKGNEEKGKGSGSSKKFFKKFHEFFPSKNMQKVGSFSESFEKF